MGRRLVGYVPVHDGDRTVWYGPDDDVPAEHAKRIGDHAWADDGDGDGDAGEPKPVDQMTLPELRKYAEDNEINLGDAQKKADVLAVIQAADQAAQ